MVTVPELVAADTGRLAAAGVAWDALATALGTHAVALDREVTGLRRSWRGPAADAATAHLTGLCDELDAATPVLYAIGQVLTEHAVTVARAQDIAVSVRHETLDPSEAVRIDEALRAALALADGSDTATASRLTDSGPGFTATPAGPPPRDPAAVTSWWHGLSPAARRTYLVDWPDVVGGLDGVPAADRDAANRARLTRLLADPRTPHRDALLAISARLRPDGYLLGLDTGGAGRAIVAYGDPDTADNVVTSIPGLGGRLDHVADELDRIGHLSDAARRAAPAESTSVVAWLGYDAPMTLVGASSAGPAAHATAALHRFQAGLRATHTGPASHNTVVGLSYGTTVVGLTGHAYGLDADDVVLLGSPGTGVTHASDLGLAPGHVWASTAPHDVINAAADPLQPGVPTVLHPLLGIRTDRLWFGPSPAGAGFGAQVFDGAPGSGLDPVAAHVGYFDPANPALATVADITTRPAAPRNR